MVSRDLDSFLEHCIFYIGGLACKEVLLYEGKYVVFLVLRKVEGGTSNT